MQKLNKFLRNFPEKIDRFLCGYFGFKKFEIIPHFIKKKHDKLIVLNTESFKRHLQETPAEKISLLGISREDKEKLEMAMGKAIASNLSISFDEVVIKKEDIYAR